MNTYNSGSFYPQTIPAPVTTNATSRHRVRLELYASQLKNVAGAFKGTSDPFAIVTVLASEPNETPTILGKTEVIKNTLSPRWTTSFLLDYQIGKLTRVNVALFDEVRKGNNKSMGSAMFEIGEILGARGNTKAKKLRQGGTLFCRVTAAGDATLSGASSTTSASFKLQLAGLNLKNVDGLFSKSDPFFEVSSKVNSAGGIAWHPVYRSKHLDNNLNPTWDVAVIELERLCSEPAMGQMQPVLISVYDWDKKGKHHAMGTFETNVQGLLQAVSTGQRFTLMHRGKNFGQIVVKQATIQGGSQSTVNTTQPQPYAVATAASFTPTRPTASLTPSFSQALDLPPPSTQPASTPPPAALLPPWKPSIYDMQSSVDGNMNSNSSSSLPPPMAPPTSRAPSFVNYLQGGCQLELCIAIDLTGSNGDPRQPGTLHYIYPNGDLNDYEKAITAVGSIIARYDSDQRFPVWGFGAKFGGVIRHCFQISPTEEVAGIRGVLDAYRQVFRSGLTMSGPTVLSEVIGVAAAKARQRQVDAARVGNQAYQLLLILTDGAVTSVEDTQRALQLASDAPLSIVIVGIGSADFSAMQFLDHFATSSQATRDICKFVEFQRYRHDRAALTKVTLDEIPNQVVEYFSSRGIMPLPPVSGSLMSINAADPNEQDVDLNLNISPEGEISLANYNGAVYDDTKYDTYYSYASSPTAPQALYGAPAQGTSYNSGPNGYGSTPTRPSALPAFTPTGSPSPPSFYQQQSYSSNTSNYNNNISNYGGFASSPGYNPMTPSSSYSTNNFANALGGGGPSSAPSPTRPSATTAAHQVFYVQVPPGVAAGSQLQIQHPRTQQRMIVTVPAGVGPGGKFSVPL